MKTLFDINLLKFGTEYTLAGVAFSPNKDDKLLLCLFPGEEDVRGNETLHEHHVRAAVLSPDEWNVLLRQLDLLDVEGVRRLADGSVEKAVLRKSSRRIDAQISWRVFRRDHYACRYCGRNDAPLTVDHLVLWEEGGPSTEENLVSACSKCNKTRGRTPYAEWLRHPYYLRVSENLSHEERERNIALVHTLAGVERLVKVRSR